jgi:hypothetical protein
MQTAYQTIFITDDIHDEYYDMISIPIMNSEEKQNEKSIVI